METIPIKYIGRHDYYTDNRYGTGLTWRKNYTVHEVPADKAANLLRHTDCFASTASGWGDEA